MALGVLEPKEAMLGIDLELRLADLELCKLGVRGASEMDLCNLGDPRRSQKDSLGAKSSLEVSLLSREFWGEYLEMNKKNER